MSDNRLLGILLYIRKKGKKMGKIKNLIKEANSEIVNCLTKAGFKYESFVCGSNYGYQKGFEVDNGLYYTYIHCDLKNRKLNVYKEYDCGGEVASYVCDIPDELIDHDDANAFIEWLDEETEPWLQTQ